MFLNFYNLRQQPFGVTPDPAYLYLGHTHGQALTSLVNGIKEGRGFFALIAEPGMGKTTLVYQLLEGLSSSARTAFLFQTQCDSREFFQYLLNELGVDTEGMGLVAMHKRLNETLFAEMLAGRRFVLVVDEAQNLDDSVLETIRLLSNYETWHTKLLQIVLAGQPQLATKLAQPQLAQLLQRLTVLAHLDPLSSTETSQYIEHRLKVAGHSGESLFLPDALALVAQKSQGIPRNINRICFNALSEGLRLGQKTITAAIVEKAAAALEVQPLGQLALVPDRSNPSVSVRAKPRLTYRPARIRLGRKAASAVAVAAVVLAALAGFLFPRLSPRLSIRPSALERKGSSPPRAVQVMPAPPQKDSGHNSEASAAAAESRDITEGVSNVIDVQTSSEQDHSRVAVTLDHKVRYDSARIPSPNRIYFEIYNARLSPFLKHRAVHVDGSLLTAARAVQDGDSVRLVLDVDGADDYLAHMEWSPYRLIIDIYSKPPGSLKTADIELATPKVPTGKAETNHTIQMPPEPRPDEDRKPSLTRELGLKIRRIVIDPGHGGVLDTGAAGPHGLLEKDVCLDVAIRLGRLIERNLPAAQVIFTRKDDTYTPLESRSAMANQAGADLFISIHANSSPQQGVRGVETYYLDAAASPQSMEVATRENALSPLGDPRQLVKSIARKENIEESKQLADDIQNALWRRLQLVSASEINRGVKKAPFIVLVGATMPAVLSEISFVSNLSDERLLQTNDHRQRLAEALYAGVHNYLDSVNGLSHNKTAVVADVHGASGSASGGTILAADQR